MDKLKEWFKPFANIRRLSFEEAKKLLRQANETDNEELRNQLFNKIVLGTMYVIYEYILNNKLYNIASQDFDIDDLTSSFTRQWITLIRNVNVEQYDTFEQMLKSNRLRYKSLIGIESDHISDIADKTNSPYPRKLFSQEQIREFFKDYISALHMKGECTVADLRKDYNDWRFDQYDESLVSLIEIFDDLYYNSWDPKRYEKGVLSLADYEVIISRLRMKSTETVSIFEQDIEEEPPIFDRKIDIMFSENLLVDALKILTPQEKSVIKKYFGLSNERKTDLTELVEEFNVSRNRINQIISKAIAKIRFYLVNHSKTIYNFKDLINQKLLLTEREIHELEFHNKLTPNEAYIARKLFTVSWPTNEYQIMQDLNITKEQYDQMLANVLQVLNKQRYVRFDIENYSSSIPSGTRR